MKVCAWRYGSFCLILLLGVSTSLVSGQMLFNYSTDIGSDLDWSDPLTPGNNISDCSDIYMEPAGPMAPPIIDDQPGGANPGYPLAATIGLPGLPVGGVAIQPFAQPPNLPYVGGGGGTSTPTQIQAQYNDVFDIDGDDILAWRIPALPVVPVMLTGLSRPAQRALGIHYEPEIYISYDDDTPSGWFQTVISLPTTSGPDMGTLPGQGEVLYVGWFTNLLSAPPPSGVRDEDMLGLPTSPAGGPAGTGDPVDDDVDALDADSDQFPYWYWSADHEGNYSSYALAPPTKYDPGSIYLTVLTNAGANDIQILDDVSNFGVPQDTDINAFEFISVNQETFFSLFGYDPDGVPGYVGDDVLIALISVDDDDPDNNGIPATDIYGNESGGLLSGMIYASDLVGSVPVAVSPDYGMDVDAIAGWRDEHMDTDHDGMDDAWEVQYFGSITASDGLGDYDTDQFIDIDEYLANTIPTNNRSFLGITNLVSSSPGSYVIWWMSATGIVYAVDQATNLALPSPWFNVQSNIMATPPVNVYTGKTYNPGSDHIRVRLDQ